MLAVLMLTGSFLATRHETAEAAGSQYKIRVNVKRNVATVYKRRNKKWKPIRAMLVSTGTPDSPTPVKSFRTSSKYKWKILYGPVRGRYCTRLGNTNLLFHSIWYPEEYSRGRISTRKNNMSLVAYRRLGQVASAGCIRMSVIDAKWVYDKIPAGTKVETYRSNKDGPLGRPKRVPTKKGLSYGWCPTDPDPKNPHYFLKPARIDLSKKPKVLKYKSKQKLTSYVRAKNPNALQNISGSVKVTRLCKWNSSKKKYEVINRKRFKNQWSGSYKVWYKTNSRYCPNTRATFKFKVLSKYAYDKARISLDKQYYKYEKFKEFKPQNKYKGIYYRQIKVGGSNPHLGVRVFLNKHPKKFVTYKMTSKLYKKQKDGSYKLFKSFKSDKQARKYVFQKPGRYLVYFRAQNPYARKKSKAARPTTYRIRIDCSSD